MEVDPFYAMVLPLLTTLPVFLIVARTWSYPRLALVLTSTFCCSNEISTDFTPSSLLKALLTAFEHPIKSQSLIITKFTSQCLPEQDIETLKVYSWSLIVMISNSVIYKTKNEESFSKTGIYAIRSSNDLVKEKNQRKGVSLGGVQILELRSL